MKVITPFSEEKWKKVPWYIETAEEFQERIASEKKRYLPFQTIKTLGGKKAYQSLLNKKRWFVILEDRGLMKCSRCGYDKCFHAIDFHHKDPSKKRIQISSLMNFIPSKAALTELDRCIPLCKNCHAEIHHEQGQKLKQSPVKRINYKDLENKK